MNTCPFGRLVDGLSYNECLDASSGGHGSHSQR